MNCSICNYSSLANVFYIKSNQIICLNCGAEQRYTLSQQPKRLPGRPPKYTPEIVQELLAQLGGRVKPDPSFFQLPLKRQIEILREKLPAIATAN